MMAIRCTDPVFIGTAIYTHVTAENKDKKLSQLRKARKCKDGRVEFDTLNSTYIATFTDARTRKQFLDTCETIGKLDVVAG